MRQTISGLVAAVAVVAASAAPAMACGYDVGYVSPCGLSYIPAPVYSGCDTGCGGWAYERLPDPVQQYYYADQGPTYTGPGDFAPYPTYREGTYGWNGYRHHPYYYGYRGHARFHHWHTHHHFHGYPEHHDLRYGGMPHHDGYGYRGHTLRRYD